MFEASSRARQDDSESSNEAQAARAILARIYIRLERIDDAATVMKTFDPDNASTNAILQVALTAPQIATIAAKVAPMLEAAVVNTDDVAQQVDAVFVAIRLGLKTQGTELLAEIHKSAKTVEAKAAVLLAEAQLVARLVRPLQVPVTRSATVRSFVVSPLSSQLMSPNRIPTNRWADVVAVDDATFVRTQQVDTGDIETRNTPSPRR